MTWIKSPNPNSVYAPNEADKRKFGVDISRHQAPFDAIKMRDYKYPKLDFIAVRAVISWAYKDPFFQSTWRAIKEVLQIPRAAYGVLYPGENVKNQVKNFTEQFPGGVFDGDVIVPDIELDHGQSRKKITDAAIEYSNRLQDWAKKPLIIYTRFGWISAFMDYQSGYAIDFYQANYWWIAQYLKTPKEDNRNLIIPKELKGIRWKTMIHQTGEKGAGKLFGVASEQIDTDRWLGTDAEFNEIWNQDTEYPIEQPEPALINITEELAAIREAANKIEQKVYPI